MRVALQRVTRPLEPHAAVRGEVATATLTHVQKPATLETGLVVQVPLFIKEGDLLKISTADKCYMGRA